MRLNAKARFRRGSVGNTMIMLSHAFASTVTSLAAAVLMVIAGMQKRLLVKRDRTCVSCGRRANQCVCWR